MKIGGPRFMSAKDIGDGAVATVTANVYSVESIPSLRVTVIEKVPASKEDVGLI